MALTRLGPNQLINLATNTTGTLGVANGGTGLTSGTTDQFLKFTGTTTIASAADNAGKILQVVNATQTSSHSTSSSSYSSIGLNLNITPSSSSNKILLLFSATIDTEASGRQGDITIWREISSSNVAINGNGFMQIYNSAGRNVSSGTFNYYDSPSTTNQILYRIALRSNTGTQLNVGANTGGNVTLTAIEVDA